MISSYLKRQRLINGTISGLLFTVGLGLTGLGAYTMIEDYQAEPAVIDSLQSELAKNCAKAIEDSGMLIEKSEEDRITAMNFNLEAPQKQIAKISVGIQQCVGYKLERFCMGSGCEQAPVTIALRKPGTANGG